MKVSNWNKPPPIILLGIILGIGLIVGLLGFILFFMNRAVSTDYPKAGKAGSTSPLPGPEISKSPLELNIFPKRLTVPLNPQHGIHAPVGGEWSDNLREIFSVFVNSAGERAAPGLIVALSVDMLAANNRDKISMEEDFFKYQQMGTQVYIRIYPQRFPGGFTENPASKDGRNTISGTGEDAAEDILRFLQGQQSRTGKHFTRIIPGNEANLEWPNRNYFQNLLPWVSGDDPEKYRQINNFFLELYQVWQRKITTPEGFLFRDVELFFPALAQDGHPDYFGGSYFYENNRPASSKFELLRPVIEQYGRFSWHNYFRPGKACQDLGAASFPEWLQKGLAGGWPYLISEAGWTPDSLALHTQNDETAQLSRLWQRLNWNSELSRDNRPKWRTQDEILGGTTFEDEIQNFSLNCAGKIGSKTVLKPGVAAWLAGSEGNFYEAVGVEPGKNGLVRRWLRNYAGWRA